MLAARPLVKWSIFQPNGGFLRESPLSYFWLLRRFKRAIRAIGSTTIELIAKCMDWAKHRKHKAAAKVHVALDLISFIPIRVVTDSANHHDGSYMSGLCGNMKSGDMAVMDRAFWAKRTVRVIVSRYGTAGESPPERHAQLPSDLPGINWTMLI